MELTPHQQQLLSFSWEHRINYGLLGDNFYQVTFKSDFGKIKKGQHFDMVSIDYYNGTIITEVDNIKSTQKFELTPINDELINYIPQ